MKVLHVIPSISQRSGGPGQAIIPMCGSLSAQGIDLLLASTDADLPTQNRPGGPKRGVITRYKNLAAIFFPLQLGASFKYSRPFALWLNAHVADYDLVHIHAIFNHSSIAAARACRANGIPYIIRPLGTLDPWSMKQKSFRKKVFWNAAVKTMLRGAAAIHYTTKGEQRAVESSLGLNHGTVVPLGVEKPVTPPPEAVMKLAARFPALLDRPYILILSRLLPTKGLDVFTDAFLSIVRRDQFKDWRLVLAGEGPEDYVRSLKRKISEHYEDNVLFPGWLDGAEKEVVLRHASLLALPSYHENFGLCVMEALAAGVPVLISPHVNLADEVKAAQAGWIADVDKEDIEAKLTEALGSYAERFKRGKAGEELSHNFLWEIIASKLKEIYMVVSAAKN